MELKKLILKLALAIMLILLGTALIRHWVDPSPWYGNEIMDEKLKYWNENHHQFNTVYIGSSIVLKNFDPLLFDSLAPPEKNIRTYNLGMGGTLPPESYKMFEWLLKNRSTELKHVLFELRDLGLFHPHHLHTLRRRYWITPKEYAFIVQTNLNSSIPSQLKRHNIAHYGISLFERLFLINYFNDLFGHSDLDPETLEYRRNLIKGTEGHGYLPIENNSPRGELFMMDTTHLGLMADTYRAFKRKAKSLPHNQPHIRRIQSMIHVCEQQGIQLWFVLHPKQNLMQIEETLGLLFNIPKTNRIDLADPDYYPQLYYAVNSYSENHFNFDGTRLLTRLLSEEVFWGGLHHSNHLLSARYARSD